ncbi:MAG: ATP-dependent DNA ligase [Burkholderiaceae bacterium]|nr:ATP-dependent DNA ligase [Burkholderiaceae bacterium]
MKAFAALYAALDASTASSAKQSALAAYLRQAPAADAAWAVYFLAGGKPRQIVPTARLRQRAREAADLPEWLFDECYEAVGDLAETIALLLPAPQQSVARSLAEWMAELLPLRGLPSEESDARLRQQWSELAPEERLVYFKLITGNLRVGVSRLQATQALAQLSGVDAKRIAHRLMGYTQIGRLPGADDYAALIAPVDEAADASTLETSGQPYPFFLAHPWSGALDAMPAALGPPQDWQIEWKWDGIRAQVVRRAGAVWIWSRGEDLVTDRFPELAQAALALPEGTVLDGEIVVWRESAAPGAAAEGDIAAGLRPFAQLQRRIGRKTLGAKLLREVPVVLIAYDLLEAGGTDLRGQPQHARRARLEAMLAGAALHPALRLSPLLSGADWPALAAQREASRALGTEGFMLKHRDAPYGVGRTQVQLVPRRGAAPGTLRGAWWKWKIDPMSVDAVLIYAQRGHGRRASLYTDYTFAVWSAPEGDAERTLVPFAKAYSGLTDAEIAQVDAIVRKTTRESFGPVRSVQATQVFELGFEGIARSPRHKSGIAVRFPRMLRWRKDKPVAEADTLQTLAALLPGGGA